MSFKLKAYRQDTGGVVSKFDRAGVRALNRFGQYVRRDARKSIKKGRKGSKGGSSEPGAPPKSHSDALRLILFSVNPARLSVVIGPIRLSSKIGRAPEALEHGGMTAVRTIRGGKFVTVPARMRQRAFMRPALARMLPKLPDLLRNSLGR